MRRSGSASGASARLAEEFVLDWHFIELTNPV